MLDLELLGVKRYCDNDIVATRHRHSAVCMTVDCGT